MGHTPSAETLIRAGADPNAQEAWGLTPLMVAAQKSHVEVMRLLLKSGADRHTKDHHHGQTALHVACAARDLECLLLLLDGGCDVGSVDKQGCSPFGIAMISRFFAALPLLREYGARLNEADRRQIPEPVLSRYLPPESRCILFAVTVLFVLRLVPLIHAVMLIDEPLTLLRLARVAYRRAVQAWNDDWLTHTPLPGNLKDFVAGIHNVCTDVSSV